MSVSPSISVFACEAQPIVVEGLARVLEGCPDLVLAGSVATLNECLQALGEHKPDIALVDQSAGLRAVFQFLAEAKNVSAATNAVLWVTDMAEIECFRALQMGARGILRKTMPTATLVDCLRAVAAGKVWIENSISNQVVGFLSRKQAPRLTPREREIVRYVCQGLKNKQIGEALEITPGTVKVHLMHIFEKTGAKDRFELAVHGRRLLGMETGQETAGEASVAV